jgi:hypothetical protein
LFVRHIKGFFRKPMLAAMVEKETDESLELNNGITIERAVCV